MHLRHPISGPGHALRAGLIAAGGVALVACGGASSGGSDEGSGTLSLGVTDAPIDSARNVFVEFSSVTLKPADDAPVTIDLGDARRIDLLDQENGDSELLLEDERVAAGDYDWIRLGVNLGEGTHIVLDDGSTHELDIPSGAQTGLKLVRGFTVVDGGSLDLTIDFDLRKSIVRTSSTDYRLKPALRLVDNSTAGAIDVAVAGQYITDHCADDLAQAAYVFRGAGIAPDDVDGEQPDPITTVRVRDDDGDGSYTGTAAFLEADTYTVTFTCSPEDDAPEANDTLAFLDTVDVEVAAGATAEYELPL